MSKEWRDIPGFEGLYQVSDKGSVRSLDREIIQMSRWGTRTENILDAMESGSWFSEARKKHLATFGGSKCRK